MKRSEGCRFFTGTIIIVIISIFAAFSPTLQAAPCKAGKRPLFFHADSTLTMMLPQSFPARLFALLVDPLDKIGYCVSEFYDGIVADTTIQEEMVMWFSMVSLITEKVTTMPVDSGNSLQADSAVEVSVLDTTAEMVVTLVQVGAMKRRHAGSGSSPLLTVSYNHEELSTFESVLIRKIIENMRDQYICHLRIESEPEGVVIRTKNGLEGITPLEWIIPVGKVRITGELEGYEPLRRTIDLNEPGSHTYRLTMGRKRFYHSRFFVSSLVLGASSAVCYGIERYYYDQYLKLGREERYNTPDRFAKDFTIAKNFERAAGATLA
ncbi:MAG: PEGA domain-containing protein, partial [Chitinispirillaceae bacterium]|nr:PEGA domain-containing protein [Chitinispirillaceae bacterium]